MPECEYLSSTLTGKGEDKVRETGVIHGRFQILHNDHLKYLLAGKERCRHLVIGITNPDPTLTREDNADPDRSSKDANPLTYYERYGMIRRAMAAEGLREEISIVPFPINFPELYHHYLPLDAVFFLTIYDRWGERKRQLFEELGLETEVLWRRPLSEKGLRASDIRRRIARGEDWEHLVPRAVAEYLRAERIVARLG